MTPTRQRLRRAGCGAVIALSAAVLFLHRPAAWGSYVAWTVARIGVPLFVLFSGVLGVGVVLVMLSRYRRKQEVLAAALALSAALHLLLAATFTLFEIGAEKRPRLEAEMRFELAPGLPSLTEELISRQMREALLKPLERKALDVQADRTETSEADVTMTPAPAPDAETPVRDPSALEPVKAETVEERRVEAGDAPEASARAEAEAERERILKVSQIETAAEPEPEQANPRQFETERVETPPMTAAEPDVELPRRELPSPDRAVRADAPDIRLDHAEPLLREQDAQRAEVQLDALRLDVPAVQEAAQVVPAETPERSVDGRMDLTVAAPNRELAETPPRTVNAPDAPVQAGTAAPLAMPQEVPVEGRRENPEDIRLTAEPVRVMHADVASLAAAAPLAESQRQPDSPSALTVPAEPSAPMRTATSTPAAAARLTAVRPELSAGATAADDVSLEADRPVPSARREGGVPRLIEGLSSAPSRQAVEEAASVNMQAAMLQALAAPAGDSAAAQSDGARRDLEAGRAVQDAVPEQIVASRSAPGSVAEPGRTALPPSGGAQTLADTQARVELRDAPEMAVATSVAASPARGARSAEQDLSGPAAPAARMELAAVPTDDGSESVPRATGGTQMMTPASRAGAGAAVAGPYPERPDAPFAAASSPAVAEDRSLAAGQGVPTARRDGVGTPRIMESESAAAPSRQTVEETAAVNMQVSLLRSLAGTAGESAAAPSADGARRDLAAGRAVQDAVPEQVVAQRSAPGSVAAPGRAALPPSSGARTLADTQAQVERRDAPDMAAATSVAASPARGARSTEQDLSGLTAPAARMATAAAPSADGTGGTARAVSPMAVAAPSRAVVSTELSGPAGGRAEAPLMPSRSGAEVSAGSLAGVEVQASSQTRSAPSAPSVETPLAAASGSAAAAQSGLVAGHIRQAESQRAVAPAEESGTTAHGAAAAGALRVERAERGEIAGGVIAGAVRPVPAVAVSDARGGGTLVDAMPSDAMPASAGGARQRPAEAALPAHERRTESGGGTVALAVPAWTVERAPSADSEAALRVPRAAAFDSIAKAAPVAADETSAAFAPLRGWKAPPPPAERGSGVRLSLAADLPAARRAEVRVEVGDGEAARSRTATGMSDIAAVTGKKAIYELRSPERRRFIQELGGSPETEEAVEKALIWLAGAQSDDGRWSVAEFKGVQECGGAGDRVDGDVAVTGLSLLAYLGASYTHMGGIHRETVRRGLEWLIEGQGADGDLRRGGTMYDQAMATAALCESLSLTGDERLAAAARRAAGFIMNAQTPEAAWRYEPRVDSDTSVLGWQILALKSAEIAGVEIPGKHFAWSGMWLDQVRKGDGGLYSYKPGHGPTPVMTAEGWFCQLFMGADAREQGQRESIAYLLENLPEWNGSGRSTVHLYYWYYATLALRLSEAPEFDIWNKALKSALLSGRRLDGSAAGSWDPVCQLGSRGGRVYMTAMAALCLEVYYRYLPFYRRHTAER